MTVELDHAIVPSRDAVASARLLGELLGVRWSPSGVGPFSPVHVNSGLTLDFLSTDEAFPVAHFCFRVDPKEFDAILARLRDRRIDFRSTVRGPVDHAVDPHYGNVYWNNPTGTSGRC